MFKKKLDFLIFDAFIIHIDLQFKGSNIGSDPNHTNQVVKENITAKSPDSMLPPSSATSKATPQNYSQIATFHHPVRSDI